MKMLLFFALKNAYYVSFALLHVGITNYLLGRYKEAYDATSKAIQKNQEISEVNYQHARYCSKLGKYEEALSNLRIAINADRLFCIKAISEKDFEPMSSELRKFLEDLKNETLDNSKRDINATHNFLDKLDKIGPGISDMPKTKLNEAWSLFSIGNYFGARDAIYKAFVSRKLGVDSLITNISSYDYKLNLEKMKLEKQKSNFFDKYYDNFRKTGIDSHEKETNIILLFFYFILFILFGPLLGLSTLSNLFRSLKSNDLGTALAGPYLAIIYIPISVLVIIYYLYIMYKELGLRMIRASLKRNLKPIEKQLYAIENELSINNLNMSIAKSEKQRLSLDKGTEYLSADEFEKYLIKKYG
jgi:tetratricopeptide (TPR) repeat protein